ncbi:response regulator transcription factor [bacterium]|nr:MAG: response regulator transcription factor [bacterium]
MLWLERPAFDCRILGSKDNRNRTVRVLVVEHDTTDIEIIREALEAEGHAVDVAADGRAGDHLAADGSYDAVVVNRHLPGLSGLDICRRLREAESDVPIVMLTAQDDAVDAANGLDAGADDYVVKPLRAQTFLARLRALVRRTGTQRSACYRAGTIEVDVRKRRAMANGEELALSAREYQLLEYLVRNAGIVLERERIEEHVWGAVFEEPSNVVGVSISRLRRKLGEAGHVIETVRGLGYRIAA